MRVWVALLFASAGLAGCDEHPEVDDAASPRDAGSPRDGSIFDGSIDAGGESDAGPPDAGCPSFGCEIACVSHTGLETGGLAFGQAFYAGFRFEIPPGSDVTLVRVGLSAQSSSIDAQTAFAAIVALTSQTDTPDDPALTSADVLGTTTMDLAPAVESIASGALTLRLAPGWYAAIYGGGAFGGTVSSATATNQNPTGPCDNGTSPFTIRTSDGNIVGQNASPHMFVVLSN